MKHKKHKHSRKEESSSSSSSSESSSDESPPRQKSKQHKRTQNRKDYEEHHRKTTSPEKSRRDDNSDDERRRTKKRRKEQSEKGRESPQYSRDSSKDRHRRDKRHRSPPIHIKKEEDFDRRQEQLRMKRRERVRENEQRPANVRIKQEPEDRPRRNDRDQGTQRNRDRSQHHDQDEQERRRNDERRAREWERREREGGNAQALAPEPPKEKEKPNLGLSGALTEDTNTFRGVVIKYNEPPEARVPKKKWRLYPFKGDEALKVLHLHRQSAYLLGRVRRIADIPIDHPSCSKQHAVIQFRLVEEQKENGTTRKITKPYIIDLESANGTFVNNQQIEARRYVELKEQDVIKFGYSSREYVLIHDKSDTTQVKDSDASDEEESDE